MQTDTECKDTYIPHDNTYAISCFYHCLQAYKQNSHAQIKVTHELTIMRFNSPKSTGLHPLLNNQSANRDQHWAPDMITVPLAARWIQQTASILEEAVLSSYWNTYFGYGFAFLACHASAKTPIILKYLAGQNSELSFWRCIYKNQPGDHPL